MAKKEMSILQELKELHRFGVFGPHIRPSGRPICG